MDSVTARKNAAQNIERNFKILHDRQDKSAAMHSLENKFKVKISY